MSKEEATPTESLSLEQKIGLMLWPAFHGYRKWYRSDEFTQLRGLVERGLAGGLVVREGVLYETATKVRELQQLSPLPLVVAGDAENGLGSLLQEGTRFPSNMAFGATRSGEYGFLAGKIVAREAGAVGINLVFGPTCCRTGAALPEGLPRVNAYGERLHLVTRLATAFLQGLHDGGALGAPRFFPATGALRDGGVIGGARWLLQLRRLLVDTELSVFEIFTQAGLGALMVDWRHLPDPLTGRPMPVITNHNLLEVFLREVMGFTGVVISPDLSAKPHEDLLQDQVLIAAVAAGVDVLAGVPEPERVLKLLCRAVIEERIPLARIEASAGRLLALRERLGKRQAGRKSHEEIDRVVASSAHLEVADRIAEDSITLLRDRRRMLPLDSSVPRTLLNLSFTAMFDPDKEKCLDAALRLEFDRVCTRQLDSEAAPAKLDEAWEEAQHAGIILCAMYTNRPPDYSAHGFSPTQVEFIQRLIRSGLPVMMVSFGDPHTISLFPEVDCYICLYSDSPASQTALVRELFGDLVMPVKGKLPVTLDAQLAYGFGMDLLP